MEPNQTPEAPASPQATPAPEPTPAPKSEAAPAQPAAQPETAPAQPAAADQPATPTQPTATAQPSTAKPAPKAKTGGAKKILIPILALVCIAIVIGVGFLIFNLISGGNKDAYNAIRASSFFIPKDSEEKSFALYDKDGKAITDFIFTKHSDFIAGYALVRNSDQQYGVINEDGKMTIAWQDDPIDDYAGLFVMHSDKSDYDLLVDGRGHEVDRVFKDDEVVDDPTITYLYHDKDDQVIAYDAYGKQIDEFTADYDDCEQEAAGNFSLVMCENHINIIDILSMKHVDRVETSNLYDEADASYGTKIIGFMYNSTYDEPDSDTKTAVYMNGNFYELGNLCAAINVYSQPLNSREAEGGYAVCVNGDKTSLIGEDGKITDHDVTRDSLAVYDANHFISYDYEAEKAKIYVDGKEVTEVDATDHPATYHQSYVVRNDKKSTIYDLNGKEVFSYEGKKAIRANGIDRFGNIVISDYDEDWNPIAFIVDKNGNKLSDEYKYHKYDRENGYYIMSKDHVYAVYDKDVKLVLKDAKCGSIYYLDQAERFICEPSEENEKLTIYDKSGKVIKEIEADYSSSYTDYDWTSQYYVIVNNSKESQYYSTLTGELIYTVK